MNIAALLLPDFALILMGYLICQYTRLNRSVWDGIDKLVYYFLFPVLLFYSIVSAQMSVTQAVDLALAGACFALIAVGLSYSTRYWPWVKTHTSDRMHAGAAQIGFRFNSFIALSVASQALGAQGSAWMSVLIGLCVPLFNVAAVWPMARHSEHHFGRELLRNPLIWATTLGLMGQMIGLTFPTWSQTSLHRLGQAALVVGLMAAGAGMRWVALHQAKSLAVSVLTVRHLFLPLVAACLAWGFSLNSAQASTLVIFGALPTASSSYVLAARMGYDGGYVAALVTLSVLLALLSLPFAMLTLLPWVLASG